MHLTDPNQQSVFTDRYFGFKIDLSQTLFCFSYNDESRVPPVLRDRIHQVSVTDFSFDDKQKIAKQFLLPSMSKELGLSERDFVIEDDAIALLVKETTQAQTGLRQVKQALIQIVRGVNLAKLSRRKDGVTFLSDDVVDNVVLPVRVTCTHVERLLQQGKLENNDAAFFMYN